MVMLVVVPATAATSVHSMLMIVMAITLAGASWARLGVIFRHEHNSARSAFCFLDSLHCSLDISFFCYIKAFAALSCLSLRDSRRPTLPPLACRQFRQAIPYRFLFPI